MKNGKVMRVKGVRNCKGEGAVDSKSQQDAITAGKILFVFNEKERKLCKNRNRKREMK